VSKAAVNDLVDQYQRAFQMLYSTLEEFDAEQWTTGISFFQVPVKLAMHVVDTLDYYFSGKTQEQYVWGHHFNGGWWELSDDQLPSKAAVLAYTKEIQARAVAELSSLEDEDLSRPFEIDDGSGDTLLGHYIYALRHTMHHQGALGVLSIHQGNDGGDWA